MKKLLLVSLALVLLLSFAMAEDVQTENVVQMTYIVKMPDVIREGLYTGETVNGVPHGYGLFTTVNSSGEPWHYIGQWVDGAITGEGGEYWDSGSTQIGTFENGGMVCGEYHQSPSSNFWRDNRVDENGRLHVKVYRTNGSIRFDGYTDAKTGAYLEGTFYTSDGKVFFSGEIGEGFDWNLIYIN